MLDIIGGIQTARESVRWQFFSCTIKLTTVYLQDQCASETYTCLSALSEDNSVGLGILVWYLGSMKEKIISLVIIGSSDRTLESS
jgi:hypothetical protein